MCFRRVGSPIHEFGHLARRVAKEGFDTVTVEQFWIWGAIHATRWAAEGFYQQEKPLKAFSNGMPGSYILQLVLPFSMANVLAAQRFDSGCDMLSPRTPAFLLDSKNVESSNFLDMTVGHIQMFGVSGKPYCDLRAAGQL